VGDSRPLSPGSSVALAERLGTSVVHFPGDHGGFLTQPAAFAEQLSAIFDKDAVDAETLRATASDLEAYELLSRVTSTGFPSSVA
jgi:hypothetical protein